MRIRAVGRSGLRAVLLMAIPAALFACGQAKNAPDVSSRDAPPESILTAVGDTSQAALPPAVEATRDSILAAAARDDLEGLRPLIPSDPRRFNYTFGPPDLGGPLAYWANLRQTGQGDPLHTLARILRYPYTVQDSLYIWPYLYGRNLLTLDDHELHQLRRLEGGEELTTMVDPEGNYLGPRTAIRRDGSWAYYVTGD